MNFFERQHQVRKVSHRLVWLFLLAVAGIIVAVDLAVLVGFSLYAQPPQTIAMLLGAVSLATGLLIGLTSWVRMLLLRGGGGGRIAQSLGGVYVAEDTTDPQLRRLRNVVEEIAIASGTPVPELYLLPNEPGINAFAAGWSPADAAVAVTRGALERLNRNELQGVIAHEFSHVVNGDMRLNIRLMGLLFGILALAVVGRFLLYGGGGRGKNAVPIVMIALVTLAAGYIGVLVGRLIKAAVSRQREYLADASAVQFTRQTSGIAGALKKIGGLEAGSKLRSGKVEDVSHMLFGDGMRLSSAFATHPPLVRRIQVLEPSFNPAEMEQLSQRWAQHPPSGPAEDQAMGLAGPPAAAPAPPRAASSPVAVRPEAVIGAVGEPTASSYERGGNILRSIPDQFQARARRPDTVVPLMLGLLMSPQNEVRPRQHAAIAARHGKPLADAAWQDAAALSGLAPTLRLPLAELAFSALRRRSQPELEQVIGTISALIHADGRVDVFEYCLSALLHTELYELMHHRPPWGEQRRRLAASKAQVAALLAVLARVGDRDPRAAEAAYRAGLAAVLPGEAIPYAPPGQGITALDSVWPALDGLDGAEKALLVQSLVIVIGHDGVMTVQEVELLRTVCGVLHCPLPPMTDDSKVAGETSAPARPAAAPQ
ncbi:MAG: M48 family metalloprotease [Micromonosporaceae bacterium]|nr:M48 family metalloprotease [Micromonosporaceae bacterium]